MICRSSTSGAWCVPFKCFRLFRRCICLLVSFLRFLLLLVRRAQRPTYPLRMFLRLLRVGYRITSGDADRTTGAYSCTDAVPAACDAVGDTTILIPSPFVARSTVCQAIVSRTQEPLRESVSFESLSHSRVCLIRESELSRIRETHT